MRYPMPSTASGTALLIAARTCSSLGRITSRCAAMYSSTDFGTLGFIPLILCFGMQFFLALIRLACSFSGRFHPHSQCLGSQLGRAVSSEKCLRSRPLDYLARIGSIVLLSTPGQL